MEQLKSIFHHHVDSNNYTTQNSTKVELFCKTQKQALSQHENCFIRNIFEQGRINKHHPIKQVGMPWEQVQLCHLISTGFPFISQKKVFFFVLHHGFTVIFVRLTFSLLACSNPVCLHWCPVLQFSQVTTERRSSTKRVRSPPCWRSCA